LFLKKLIFLFNYFFNQKFECSGNVKINDVKNNFFKIKKNYFDVFLNKKIL